MRPAPLVILASLLLVLAYPTWWVSNTTTSSLSPLIWVALMPWLVVLHQAPNDPRKSLIFGAFQSLVLGLLMTLGGFYWVAFAIHRYGQVPLPVGFLGLLVFGLFNQIQFVAFGALYARFHRIWDSPLFWAAVYTLIDAATPKLFQDSLGHSQWNLPWTRSWAAIGGVSCITLAIVWFQLLCARAVPKRLAMAGLGLALFVVCGALLHRTHAQRVASAARTLPVAVLQANLGDFEKVTARLGYWSGSDHILDTHFQLGDEALRASPRPKVLIWAETAYPSTFRTPRSARELAQDQKMETYARTRQIPLWFGGYDTQAGKDFNSVFFLSPWGEQEHRTYHKHVLLPFGETIPFLEDGGFLKSWIPNMGFFGRGPGPQVFDLELDDHERIRVSPIVCYEALIESYTRQAALQGAQVFLNVTNDSWFGNTSEPHLHMVLTVFRSIETGIPQIRATNTGISMLSDASGEIRFRGPMFEPGVVAMNVPVPNDSTLTIYVRGGRTWLLWILALFVVGHLGHRYRNGVRSRLSRLWTRP